MIWEQELYNQFAYKTPREYFHTFEGEVSNIFSSDNIFSILVCATVMFYYFNSRCTRVYTFSNEYNKLNPYVFQPVNGYHMERFFAYYILLLFAFRFRVNLFDSS